MKLGSLFAVTAQAAVSKKLLFEEQQALGAWPYDWAAEECQTDMFPDKRVITQPESFTIDLDAPAETRWLEVGQKMGDKMKNDMNVLMNTWSWVPGGFMDYLLKNVGDIAKHLDHDFVKEMKGLASGSGLTLDDIVFFNVIYELSAACTSIVAQDADGNIIHGRNADFGPYGGVDLKTLTWALTETMKHDVIHVTYHRSGKEIFQSTTFSGYIGALTASKSGAFAMTANSRYVFADHWKGIVEWIIGDHSANFLAPLTREIFDKCDDYECARDELSHAQLVTPVYFIVSSGEKPEGAIITRGRKGVDGVLELNSATAAGNESGSWYLVETNSDPDQEPPFWDRRRAPAVKCMKKKTQNITPADVFDVLSTKPMLNMMTVFTTIMNPATGHHESYVRSCDYPCPPW